MGFFKAIGSFLFGGGGAKTVEKVADIADKAFHTEQEKTETDQKDLADARAMQMTSHSSLFDVFVDGLNRLVRPGVTLWIIGGFIGWWVLPASDTVDVFWQNTFWVVLTFWFGGRALLRDLPAAIRMMRGL